MALLRPRVPEARLVIAGEGELRPALEAQVRERGLADRVIFAGFRRDLDRLLPAFSVFCLSSRLEGLGTSLLDAMAFGLPVVATAAGGIPEAVEDGVTGRLSPPRDPAALAGALADILGDETRRRAFGAAGRRRFLEHFTADHMVAATLAVLEEVA
jgi:glycosyltransferase involved in cell wall biosynthesis